MADKAAIDLPVEVWQHIFKEADLPRRALARCMRISRAVHEAITPILYYEIDFTPRQLHSPLYDAFAAAMSMSGSTPSTVSSVSGNTSGSCRRSSRLAQPRSSALAKRRKVDVGPVRSISENSSGYHASKAYSKVKGYDASKTRKALALACVRVVNVICACNLDGGYSRLDFSRLTGVEIVRLNLSELYRPQTMPDESHFTYLRGLSPTTFVIRGLLEVDGRRGELFVLNPFRVIGAESFQRLRQLVILIGHSGTRTYAALHPLLLNAGNSMRESTQFSTAKLPPIDVFSDQNRPHVPLDKKPAHPVLAPGLNIHLISSPTALAGSACVAMAISYCARVIRATEERGIRYSFVNIEPRELPENTTRSEHLRMHGSILEDDSYGIRPNAIRTVLTLDQYKRGVGRGLLSTGDLGVHS